MKKSLVTIVSGWAKGMPLATPPGLSTRPTAARVREAVFSLLANDIVESAFLDLFAGSGAMGFEALSRGASRAIFVDRDRMAQKCLHQNAQEITRRACVQGLELPAIQVLNHDVFSGSGALNGFGKGAKGGKGASGYEVGVEIAYVDPPYDLVPKYAEGLFELLQQVVLPHGIILFESRSGHDAELVKHLADSSVDFRWIQSKVYGQAGITVIQREASRSDFQEKRE